MLGEDCRGKDGKKVAKWLGGVDLGSGVRGRRKKKG